MGKPRAGGRAAGMPAPAVAAVALANGRRAASADSVRAPPAAKRLPTRPASRSPTRAGSSKAGKVPLKPPKVEAVDGAKPKKKKKDKVAAPKRERRPEKAAGGPLAPASALTHDPPSVPGGAEGEASPPQATRVSDVVAGRAGEAAPSMRAAVRDRSPPRAATGAAARKAPTVAAAPALAYPSAAPQVWSAGQRVLWQPRVVGSASALRFSLRAAPLLQAASALSPPPARAAPGGAMEVRAGAEPKEPQDVDDEAEAPALPSGVAFDDLTGAFTGVPTEACSLRGWVGLCVCLFMHLCKSALCVPGPCLSVCVV